MLIWIIFLFVFNGEENVIEEYVFGMRLIPYIH